MHAHLAPASCAIRAQLRPVAPGVQKGLKDMVGEPAGIPQWTHPASLGGWASLWGVAKREGASLHHLARVGIGAALPGMRLADGAADDLEAAVKGGVERWAQMSCQNTEACRACFALWQAETKAC